jgi:hypothetical protein
MILTLVQNGRLRESAEPTGEAKQLPAIQSDVKPPHSKRRILHLKRRILHLKRRAAL